MFILQLGRDYGKRNILRLCNNQQTVRYEHKAPVTISVSVRTNTLNRLTGVMAKVAVCQTE